MATLNGQQPYVRYMTFTNDLLYTTTTKNLKSNGFTENPYTHILGYTKEDMDAPYVEITAKLSEIKDDTLKLKITNFLKIFLSLRMVRWLRFLGVAVKLMNDGEPQECIFNRNKRATTSVVVAFSCLK